MSKIILNLDIDCENIGSTKCHLIILNKIKDAGFSLLDVNKNSKGHLSSYHVKHKHEIWLFMYDNDGKHESVSYHYEDLKPGKTYDRINKQDGRSYGGTLTDIVYNFVPSIDNPISMKGIKKATSKITKTQFKNSLESALDSNRKYKSVEVSKVS